MSIELVLNSLGIVLNIIGVLMIYFNSPINDSVIDGGDASTDHGIFLKKDRKRNKMLKLGVLIIVLGSILQLVSNFA